MEFEELLEARATGATLPPLEELPREWRLAFEAHDALLHALGETILLPASGVDRAPPQLPSDYEIIRELGRGGMGIVYLAEQRSLCRQIAIKVLRPGERTFGPLLQRFVEEARHLARLRHPNIVSVHEIGEADDEPYFTMDYVEGSSLADLLRSGPPTPTKAIGILKQATAAISYAHAQGIIHRDLKPANLLVLQPVFR